MILYVVHRWVGEEWQPIAQEDLRLCVHATRASRMDEINAIRGYRPREELGGVWAARERPHAEMVRELLVRGGADQARLQVQSRSTV